MAAMSYAVLVAAAVAGATTAAVEESDARVLGIVEGDTIVVDAAGEAQEVRIAGVDCPELAQPYGNEAAQMTRQLCLEKTVRLRIQGRDVYGHPVADVTLPDGRRLSQELLRNGLAWFNERDAAGDVRLRELHVQAMLDRRGLWAQANPMAPWDFRIRAADAAVKDEGEATNIAPESIVVYKEPNSFTYHRENCKYRPAGAVAVTLQAAVEGMASPCDICRPPTLSLPELRQEVAVAERAEPVLQHESHELVLRGDDQLYYQPRSTRYRNMNQHIDSWHRDQALARQQRKARASQAARSGSVSIRQVSIPHVNVPQVQPFRVQPFRVQPPQVQPFQMQSWGGY